MVNSSLLTLNDESFFQLIFYDITQRKEMERRLKTSEKLYRKAYKNTRFLKDLFSHDISNILQSILSTVDLYTLYRQDPIEKKAQLLEKVDELFSIIYEQVKRGEDLVSNVNSLSHLQESKISPHKINIYKAFEELRSSLLKRYGKDTLEISLKAERKDISVPGSPFLTKVFKNILLDAIAHKKSSKTELTIHLSIVERKNRPYVRVEFENKVRTIPEGQKDEMFNTEFEENKEFKRTELGLLLVKQIIEWLGGKVWIEDRIKNVPSEGCLFIILLPFEET